MWFTLFTLTLLCSVLTDLTDVSPSFSFLQKSNEWKKKKILTLHSCFCLIFLTEKKPPSSSGHVAWLVTLRSILHYRTYRWVFLKHQRGENRHCSRVLRTVFVKKYIIKRKTNKQTNSWPAKTTKQNGCWSECLWEPPW